MRAPAAPKTLSQAINIAIDDLIALERDKRYRIDMGTWHYPEYDYSAPGDEFPKVCSVCFAGSVMARTCNTDPTEEVLPESFSTKWQNTFEALDSARSGYINEAIEAFYYDKSAHQQALMKLRLPRMLDDLSYGIIALKTYSVPQYSEEPSKFKRRMQELASRLKAVGL